MKAWLREVARGPGTHCSVRVSNTTNDKSNDKQISTSMESPTYGES